MNQNQKTEQSLKIWHRLVVPEGGHRTRWDAKKLDGLGPADTRPSTN